MRGGNASKRRGPALYVKIKHSVNAYKLQTSPE